jgi:predicted dehydrogenase
MNKKIKWGVLGLGGIAHKFVADLLLEENATLYGVASRSIEKASDFASKYNCPNYYNSYEELVKNDEIDIIYIATTHQLHAENTILCLNHKKAVLCEKPFAINKKQVLNMIQASKENSTFLMEALWTRFIPGMLKIKEMVDEGVIGEIKYINADFSFKSDLKNPRIYDIGLGGGSLLDIGIYPIFITYLVLGKPKEINAQAHFFETGADSQLSMLFNYNTALAVLYSSFNSTSKRLAKISGTKGEIIIDAPWNETVSFSVITEDDEQKYSFNKTGRGYTHQITECHNCLLERKTESSIWSHQNSIDLISIQDDVRQIIGLEYNEDKE